MFQVQWSREATEALADLWVRGDSEVRAALSVAATRIDKLLKRDGPEVGESRPGDMRIMFVPPLGVVFQVSSDGRTMRVADLWQYR